MKNFFPILCTAGLLAFAAFMETPGILQEKDTGSMQAAYGPVEADKASKDKGEPILESKLVDTREENGYIVEKYQEFEVFTDKSGKVIKSIPTAKIEYLRYKE
ncbi:hypothetical protein JOC77_002164 [Peribacillus deserti]|uniref:PepSY domain-containing protein n=1 Tax=Peribacillus deserti TaxID=673318 RepID=A0ABS2QHU6_9BACI|nr:hypothetical protein [Peribacillus deserti]MBM7692733.1 hypothetical protein [Peribacillus deserti]